MLFNVWNDPETEMIEAAIDDYIKGLPDEDIDALINGSESIEDLELGEDTLYLEMVDDYQLLDMESTKRTFLNKLNERMVKWKTEH